MKENSISIEEFNSADTSVHHQQLGYNASNDEGLYSCRNEHDACGVGLVANLNNVASHEIVIKGLTILKRLMHRGAAGGDAATGDGAGLLMALPDAFFRSIVSGLPEKGKYGVAMVFGGEGAEKAFESIITNEGGKPIAWRNVPINPDAVGEVARAACPCIRQLFIDGSAFASQSEFERKLFVMRRLFEKTNSDAYICSMSSRDIVYKGLLLATQVENFYPDLANELFASPLALVHQRYSTNTFPTWALAHPFRYLAHNGEINTLRGNLNALKAREQALASELFGDDLQKVLPIIAPGQSDSASLDNLFELLVAAGRDLAHSMLMLMPQAWGVKYTMGRDARGFFEYHSALMEPWDGPAAVAFTDGVNAGAALDRNGLRPARYTLCKDGTFVLASETGVLDIDPEQVLRHGRLKPGSMVYLDLEHHRLLEDSEIKAFYARRRPYRRWVEENRIAINGLFQEITPATPAHNMQEARLRFGYTQEDLEEIILPMAREGHEPVGSMGNDAALAVLSDKPQLLFAYFKQLFAQVTNPPIDPIREELVMSLMTYIGNVGNILEETPDHARLIKLRRPVLTDDEVRRLSTVADRGFRSSIVPMFYAVHGGATALKSALDQMASQAVEAAKSGARIIILSDRDGTADMAPIPSLLATAAVNRALVSAGLRCGVGLIVQTGEAREVMHFALLIGFGATAVNPYLALQTVTELIPDDAVGAASNYIEAIDKGLLKIMSKMGISTLRSYRSAQTFEAVGLAKDLVDEYFTGTASRVGGIGLEEIARECAERAQAAVHNFANSPTLLPSGGAYHYRNDGEEHLWTPSNLANFRHAVQSNDLNKFREYSASIDNPDDRRITLRSLFRFRKSVASIPIDEVESVDSIVKHFVAGAMSLGSLSPEAHEAIAIALNSLGSMSNSGEGGENEERFGTDKNCGIKQVASGRFGVTINYLRAAKDLQIKLAQGAKPGEGGQLPAHKVNPFVAKLRHSMPGVTLISPPPHHDIYSIEDLAQLIYDLHNANPNARVSVKLVSEVGVGTIAAGVAKAHAEVILISGHDGGTGAAPLTSMKHAGLPWELGLAEAQQTLVKNNLRSRVRLQVDGQLRTGRDVVIGALLGAEEFGFGTTMLCCLGCIQDRRCHCNTCPVGIATQDPDKRRHFCGKPEFIVNYLRFVATEVREILASLGLRSLDEACGRTDLLETNRAIDFFKARNIDFSELFHKIEGLPIKSDPAFPREPLHNYDREHLLPAFNAGNLPLELNLGLSNVDRTVGTELSGEIASKYGSAGLPEGSVRVRFNGVAGQSFGAFLAHGVEFCLYGEANDYLGKGLSGGTIVVRKPENSTITPEHNVIAGNVIAYGATSGQIYLGGQAGERFAIRNSGATLVCEGVGDHGCEYMTGGRVVILGKTGVNFGAGMTGGIAYVFDEDGAFDVNCNLDGVDLEPVERDSQSEAELLEILQHHIRYTSSPKAHRIIDNWESARPLFVKVFPVEYKNALAKQSAVSKSKEA